MPVGSVSKRTVDALKPGPKDLFLWDATMRGFGVKCTPAGNRVYLLQYRMGGRGSPTKRYTIGTHGSPWTPTTARDEAERLLMRVRQGVDPSAEKEERRRVAVDLAFPAYADRFLELEVKHKWKGSYSFAEGLLRNHIVPALRTKALPAIRKTDLAGLFDGLPANQTALRRNAFTVLRRLFNWAEGRGDIASNPLTGFEAPPAPDSRDHVLKDAELRLAWIASGEMGYPFGPFYRLLIGTGQRREEVAGIDWRELDRAAAEWLLPAERAKNGVATIVHLSAPMIAALDAIAGGDKWPRKGLVLSSNGATQISGYSKAKARLDRLMIALGRKEAVAAGDDPEHVEIEAWRVHDLRRTLSTGMQKLGVRFEVVEAVLNHVSGSKAGVAGVYQRHDWKDEKRAALDAWNAHVAKLETGTDATNVVPMARTA